MRRTVPAPPRDITAVMLLALGLRVAWLASVPPALNIDELTIGYDAYSLLLEGRDIHGVPYPFLFRSLGEYKNPLYIYATVPSVMLLGLNAWGVRLPAAAFGTLAVGAAFVLGRVLAGRRAGLMAALLLAVSPWHLHLSRLGMDPIPVPFLIAFGWYLMEVGLRGDRRAFLLASLPLCLSLYSYAVPRLFIPLFVAGVLLARRGCPSVTRGGVAGFLVLSALMLLPLAHAYLTMPEAANARFRGISIFSEDVLMWQEHRFAGLGLKDPRVLYALQFAQNYLAHISPDFLLLGAGYSWSVFPRDTGRLYLFEGILLLVGLYTMVRLRRPAHLLVLWGLLLFPVAASLTNDAIPHSLRTVVALPFLQLACALGWVRLEPAFRGTPAKGLFLAGATVLVLYHTWYYFLVYPSDPTVNQQLIVGWREAGAYMRTQEGSWQEIRVPDQYYGAVQATSEFLQFHTVRDPALLHRQGWEGSVYNITRPCSYRTDGGRPGVLYVVHLGGWPLRPECRFDDLGLVVKKHVTYPGGRIAFLFLARR